jgi:hypothetical protein
MPTTKKRLLPAKKRPGLPALVAYHEHGHRFPAWVLLNPIRVECLAGLVGRSAYVWVIMDYTGIPKRHQARHSGRVRAYVDRLKRRGWRHVETAGAAHAPA